MKNYYQITYNLWLKNYDFILDLLFPKFCLSCQKEGKWICAECYNKIVFIKKPTCPSCNRINKQGKFCRRCQDKSNLTGLISAAYYGDNLIKEAIHTFKYEGVFDLAKDLGQILQNRLNLIPFRKCNEVGVVIIPVPLHKKRKAKRGYNQAELLAKQIANNQWLIANNKLIRIKHTEKSQAELSGKARRQNVKGVFVWRGRKNELKAKKVLLIDDIYTTGATLEECAKVLREQAEVKEIWGLVIAKA